MDLGNVRVVAREYEGCFDVIHEPSGRVLLTTQNVSVETLVHLSQDAVEVP